MVPAGVGAVGKALTVMVTVFVFEQPLASVPVMVYVWVEVGVAITVAPVVSFKPVPGDHEYVEAPEAVMVVDVPLHTVALVGVLEIVGKAFTVTLLSLLVEVQLPDVICNLYQVLPVGVALGV